MENNNDLDGSEEFEDTFSLCDLSLYEEKPEHKTSLSQEHANSPPNEDYSFEFSTNPYSKSNPTVNNIFFCGKFIPYKTEETNSPCYGQRNSLVPLSSTRLLNKSNRSHSFDLRTPKPASVPSGTRTFRCNSGNSRKHKVLIGLARIPPKMELSDIKKRQNRLPPASMLPSVMVSDEEPAVVSGKNGGGKKGQNWGLSKSLWCRDYLANAFAKFSFGCVP